MNDGTFGTTGEAEPLDEEIVARVEGHRYDPVRVLQWRNSDLDFGSLDSLLASLDAPPPTRGLGKARPASDFTALRLIAANDEVLPFTATRTGLHRLWDACQLPDFRKLSVDEHVRLVQTIFLYLMSDDGVLPEDWLARQIERLNVTEGDVATLSGRLAQIRTWTYASHRANWTKDSAHWQGVTRAVEDRLSDALHEQLTQRFIDRRTSVLMKRLREDEEINLTLDDSGGVAIGGEVVGKLEGFRFEADARAEGIHGKTLRAAAMRGLEGEFVGRARRLTSADDKDIVLSEHGKLWWNGAVVAHLRKGPSPLNPTIEILADERLKGDLRAEVQIRLEAFVQARIAHRLQPLLSLGVAIEAKPGTPEALPGPARGVAHQMLENFGSLERAKLSLPDNIGQIVRALKNFGIWFGRRSVYLPKMLRPDAASLLGLLWGVWHQKDKLPAPPQAGLTSFANDGNMPAGFLAASGFRDIARRAIRLDMLERLEEELEKGAAAGANAESLMPKLVSLIGSGNDELKEVLAAMGWEIVEVADTGNGVTHVWRKQLPKPPQGKRRHHRPPQKPKEFKVEIRPDSPFASLAALVRK